MAIELSSNTEKTIAVRTENLCVQYGYGDNVIPALKSVNVEIQKGTIYGLIGPSGCGKTTLLKTIMGLLQPHSGNVWVYGYRPGSVQSGVPGAGVGYMPQDVSLNEDLTLEESLLYFGRLYLMPETLLKSLIPNILQEMELPEKGRLVGNLSGGQKRRISFAVAAMHRPRLLVLDEPTVGLDPLLTEKIWRILFRFNTENESTIIITTHYYEELRRAHRIGFIRDGRLLEQDTPQKLLERYNANNLDGVFLTLCTNQKGMLKPTEKTQVDEEVRESQPMVKDAYVENHGKTKLQKALIQHKALSAKYLTQIFRRPEPLGAELLIPLMVIFIFCIAFGGTPQNLKLGVINEDICYEDEPCLSELLVKTLDSYLFKKINYTSQEEAWEDARSKQLWGYFYIKPNFTDAISRRLVYAINNEPEDEILIDESTVTFHADVSDKILRGSVEIALNNDYQRFAYAALQALGHNPRMGKLPIVTEGAAFGNLTLSDFFGVRDFGAPGVLISVPYCVSYALVTVSLILDYNHQMFDRNRVLGVNMAQVLAAQLCVRFVFSLMGSFFIIMSSIYILDVPCRGSLLAAISLMSIESITGMFMGILFFCITPVLVINAFMSIGVFLFFFVTSGVLWSTTTQPYYMQWFAHYLPLTIPVESLRGILARGLSIREPRVYHGFLVAFAWMLIFTIIATIALRLRKRYASY